MCGVGVAGEQNCPVIVHGKALRPLHLLTPEQLSGELSQVFGKPSQWVGWLWVGQFFMDNDRAVLLHLPSPHHMALAGSWCAWARKGVVSAAEVPPIFYPSQLDPLSQWSYISKIGAAGLCRPFAASEANPQAKKQMFPYPEESSGTTPPHPAGAIICSSSATVSLRKD